VYQNTRAAILGDRACGFDLQADGYAAEVAVETLQERRRFGCADMSDFEPAWFERGRLRVLSGAAEGHIAVIKRDRFVGSTREIEIWEAVRSDIAAGDLLRLEAGCDKSMGHCRLKFNNLVNFRGFPDIPGEDWLASAPQRIDDTNGGSLRRFGGAGS